MPTSLSHSEVDHRNLKWNSFDQILTRFHQQHSTAAVDLRTATTAANPDQVTDTSVPLKSVDPPDNTMFEKSVRRKSMSDFWMAKARTSCIPSHSSPIRSGRNSSSGARNRACPTCNERAIPPMTMWRADGQFQHISNKHSKSQLALRRKCTSVPTSSELPSGNV